MLRDVHVMFTGTVLAFHRFLSCRSHELKYFICRTIYYTIIDFPILIKDVLNYHLHVLISIKQYYQNRLM